MGGDWLSAANQQGNRAVIDDVDPHHGTEAPGLGIDAQIFHTVDEIVVEVACHHRFGGVDERGPSAFTAIAQQGELGHHQHLAARI